MISEDVRKEWVAALRSGKYEQAREVLKSNDGKFCCLGVLADLDPEYSWITGGSQQCYSLLNPAGEASEAEFEYFEDLQHFGLSSEAQRYLIRKNDTDRASFEQIANDIEQGDVIWSDGEDNHKLVQI